MELWFFYVILYLVTSVSYTQFFKISTKKMQKSGALIILLQMIAGFISLLMSIFFKYSFPTDYKVWFLLGIACVFYALADRFFTTVRKGLEASVFGILQQLSTVFMIFAGFIFFREGFVLTKVLGALLIILSNMLIFLKKGKAKLDKYILLGILANIVFTIALFLDVNISNKFNLPFYISFTLIVPALLIFIFERIKIKEIKNEFIKGNRKTILITSISWSLLIFFSLKAYQLGEVTVVAPLEALTTILNVIIGYILLKERDNLLKKVIASILIIISVILIKS